jgi:outer membrane protein assembly factor BamB
MPMKKRWQGIRIAAIIAGMIQQSATPLQLKADWPLPRGDAASRGAADGTMPQSPELLWKYEVPKGAFESTPIVVEGKVYIGDMDGNFFALDLQDGKELWKRKSEGGFLAGAAYDQGLLVVGDYDGKVQALDPKTGELRWEFTTGAQIDAGANFFQSLVLVTSEDGVLYALDRQNGQLVWKYEAGDQLRCGPTLVGSQTLLGGCDGQLHVVDLTTGKAAEGKWPLGGPTGSTPAAIDGMVVVPTHSGPILAFRPPEGEPKWNFNDPERSPEVRSSPAVHAGSAYITTRNRRLLALSLADGQLQWESVLRKRSDSSPVYCDGRVWLGATDGSLYAIDAKNGEVVWQKELPGSFLGSPAIDSGKMVIANDQGVVFCFGAPSR